MRSQTKWKLTALSSVTFIMVFGNSMIIPVFTLIRNALDISLFQVALLVTYYSVAASIFIPVFGFISDHIQRKSVIIVALALYGLGGSFIGFLALFSDNPNIFPIILASRIVQGIGAAGMSPIAMALVGDIFTTEERAKALGLIEAANIFGKVISPILGGALALIAWFAPFFFYLVFAIPALLGVLFIISEPDNKPKTPFKKYFSDLKKIFTKNGKFLWVSYFTAWVSFLILFGVLAYLSDVLETRYDMTGIIKGVVIAIPVTAWTISSFGSGYYLQKKTDGLKYFVITGVLMLGASAVAIPYMESIYFFLAAAFVMGLGGGLVIPSLTVLVTNCAPTEERGGIMSLYGSIRFFGVAVGPPLFSYLLKLSHHAPFWLSGALAIIPLIILIRFKNQDIIKLCKAE
ncbi:MFS transporter [Dethiobacter alkaliphilus]|uniref:MFS transporter n=1 Tax=Dethiobacter alkaliphilus TaxID=427926 RepID=UPI0022261887|nr:MFS transporter [Dethiobacter alkaliphilus]MCW3489825.1 MFS transporter [Dethiobacter alkaliphilus]